MHRVPQVRHSPPKAAGPDPDPEPGWGKRAGAVIHSMFPPLTYFGRHEMQRAARELL